MDDKKINKSVEDFLHQKYIRVLLDIGSLLFYVIIILAVLKLIGLALVTWGFIALLLVLLLCLMLILIVLGVHYGMKKY